MRENLGIHRQWWLQVGKRASDVEFCDYLISDENQGKVTSTAKDPGREKSKVRGK
ncbi:MAG: hypothetical protein V3U75_12705 [Methylococcaceae bacterium]